MKNIFLLASTLILLLTFYSVSSYAQFEYIYPRDGGKFELPQTTIILRNGALMDPNSLSSDLVTITGSKSGVIPASIILATDEKTVCITPSVPFAYDENVSVTVKDGLSTLAGQILSGTSINFSVRKEMTAQEKAALQEYLDTHDDDGNLINDPDQQSTYVPPPAQTRGTALSMIHIYTNNNPAPGKIFFNENSGVLPASSAERGYGIMESNGDSVFYRASNIDGPNFHLNYNGLLTALRLDFNVDTGVIELDAAYNVIDVVHCKNGLAPSQHEHIFFLDGTKWFSIYDWVPTDLSAYGGGSATPTNISWIQELDANDNVIFQWRTDQYFLPNDAAPDILATINQSTYDPWHINAFYIDNDGNIIVSLRNMDRVIKINGSTGNIIWQWGGLGATSTISNTNVITTIGDPDGGFSHQHNVHRNDNDGHILMLDNGNLQPNPFQQSKPKEYILDEANLTATCIWYYTHPQVNGFNMFTKNQGSAFRLSNGNTIIGYGLPSTQGLPNGTEIDVNKNIVWEFRFKDSTEYSYRVYKGDNNVGISNVASKNDLNIFPNPGQGIVYLEANVAAGGKAEISVMNLVGQTVYVQSESFHSGKNITALDLSKLENGFYIARVQIGDTKWVGRILLQD